MIDFMLMMNGGVSGELNMDLGERLSHFFKNPLAGDSDVVNLCKERAKAGEYDAMLWLARMYRDGKGVRRDKAKALVWYKKSKNNNVFSRFEFLAIQSNRERKFNNIPEGLKIDRRKKERLFVYEFDIRCMDLLVRLFPFTHYNIVGFSYGDKTQPDFNKDCSNYDKILVASIDNSQSVKDKLILSDVEENKIIMVKLYQDKETFDGPSIICDFGSRKNDRNIWVMVPDELHGLIWFVIKYKLFKGANLPDHDFVVDMQNHFSQLMDDQDIGFYNPWDYYFESDSSVSLKEAYSGSGVILSSWMPKKTINLGHKPMPSKTMLRKMEAEIKKAGDRKKVLGIICRGTDYVSMQPYNHGVPLDAYELIEVAEERMNSLGYTDIYLNTEDQDAYEVFIKHFGARMYAIEQKRFKGASVLNAKLIEEEIIETFGKLIQGERYLIATYLMLKCDSALTCYGAGSSFVRSNIGKVVETHIKGNWGKFGNKPLIVRSHNKNHFSLPKTKYDEHSDIFVDSNGLLNNVRDKENIFTDAEMYLSAEVDYVCSFLNKDTNSVSLSLIFSSEDGKKDTVDLFHGSVFRIPFDSCQCTAIVKRTSIEDLVVGIQIEEGIVPTTYESYRYSETSICLRDIDNNEYVPDTVDYIDFARGTISSNGIERILNYEEVERYHGIICYSNGFLTYHCGKVFLGSSKPGKADKVDEKVASIKIIGSPTQSRRFSHTIELADILIKGSKGEMEEALCIYSYHAMNGNVDAKRRLAGIYRDGTGVQKDIDKAISFFREVVFYRDAKSNNDLIDLLIKRGTEEDLKEAFYRATDYASKDLGAKWRLSRLYRDGGGVQKDIDKAIELMREVASKKVSWSRNEFVDLLHKRGKDGDLREAFTVAEDYASEGSEGAIYRLARMYRDGRGVDKNLDKAIDLMRVVSRTRITWSKNELFDMLWERGTVNDIDEMKELVKSLVAEGDSGAMGRLARMYRDGRGVDKNLDKAIELMKRAAEKNPLWNRELKEIQGRG